MHTTIRTLTLLILGLAVALKAPAEVTIEDSHGSQTFDSAPERVVALNWSMAENLIELGIEPVGVADVEGYRKWVGKPELPEDVVNVGKRSEPNMERIDSLDPDLVLLSNGQTGLSGKMTGVAPVLYFKAFSEDHDNPEVARQLFRKLATLFDREARAERKLAQLEARFIWLRGRLRDHFGESMPDVSSMVFTSPSVARVFGDNSMPQHVLKRLGMEPALPQPRSQWGQVQKEISELGRVEEGILLYFRPTSLAGDLLETPLWKALPAVEKDRVAPVDPSWTYGGAMSLRYLAEHMTDALLTIEP
ncbi:MAG: ABC transporter substrate-binding protein [Pseudomonadota bacterium]